MNYFVNTDTVMMRKECFEQTGGFDENLESFEDMDFFYRLASLYKAALVDKPLVVINAQEDNITNDRKKFYKGRIAVIEKVKKLFPEKTKELGFPGRRSEADILNFIGSEHLNANQKKMAFKVFLKSIRTIPFQKRVYLLILTTLFQIVNRRPPVTDESKKKNLNE